MLLPNRDSAIGLVVRAAAQLADAEDSVHDALLRLACCDDLDPTRVRSLLIRASLNIAVDRRRAATRQQEAVSRLADEGEAKLSSPEEIATMRAEIQRVLIELNTLPRRERQVTLLRLAGFNVKDTAARLRISSKSVEGARTRALARLRTRLGSVPGRPCGSPGTAAPGHRASPFFTQSAPHYTDSNTWKPIRAGSLRKPRNSSADGRRP